ncbi:MAG: class I SAM-dependent methyltransferase [Acidobacteriota bacterium]|nr:class I SAM-dependent methyltransferase [Acidobacteriota bacterium]
MDLQAEFGDIDIYLFDQLLRGRIAPGMRVFDAGCGGGRNLVYLLRNGYDVCGNDAEPAAIAQVTALAARTAPGRRHDFRVEPIEQTSFPDGHADVVLMSAVLHFARDAAHFEAMLRAAWRVLRPGGVFFARLASTIGIEQQVRPISSGPAFAAKGRYDEVSPKLAPVARASEGGRFGLPDGSDRYLVDAPALLDWTARLGGDLIDPLKTTLVHEQRSMTTWVMRRR